MEPEPMPVKSSDDGTNCVLFRNKSKKKTQIKTKANVFDEFRKSKSVLKRAFLWICGVESMHEQDDDDLAVVQFTSKNFMEQNTLWSYFNNFNMIVQLCISGFMWVFFNKFSS